MSGDLPVDLPEISSTAGMLGWTASTICEHSDCGGAQTRAPSRSQPGSPLASPSRVRRFTHAKIPGYDSLRIRDYGLHGKVTKTRIDAENLDHSRAGFMTAKMASDVRLRPPPWSSGYLADRRC